jgi:hypothetical protein
MRVKLRTSPPQLPALLKHLRENGGCLKKAGWMTGGVLVCASLGYLFAVFHGSQNVDGTLSVAKLVFCFGSIF